MTKREIASLACKILAIWLFVKSILFVGSILFVVTTLIKEVFEKGTWATGLSLSIGHGFFAVLFLILAWILWAKSDSLGARMVGKDTTPVTRSTITKEEWTGIALVVLGLYVFVGGARELVVSISGRFFGNEYFNVQLFISSIIQLIIAIWMMVGSKGLVRWIWKIRTMGQKAQAE